MYVVTISISHNTCSMKRNFILMALRTVWHWLLLILIARRLAWFSFFDYFVFLAMGLLGGKELWGHLVQPSAWSRSVAKARSIQPRLCLAVSWKVSREDLLPLQVTYSSTALTSSEGILPYIQPEPLKPQLWPLPLIILSTTTWKSLYLDLCCYS